MRNWHNTSQKAMRGNPLYRKWEEMMKRRLPSFAARRPSYAGIVIDDDFLEFDKFEAWAKNQVGYDVPKWHLDKDALKKGNRTYGPDFCVFVPIEINSMLAISKCNRGELPIGVQQAKKETSGYIAICCAGGSRKVQTGFASPQAAFDAYKRMRESAIRAMAEKWRGQIDDRVYQALMSWDVCITD